MKLIDALVALPVERLNSIAHHCIPVRTARWELLPEPGLVSSHLLIPATKR